jgi:hypothetical protein
MIINIYILYSLRFLFPLYSGQKCAPLSLGWRGQIQNFGAYLPKYKATHPRKPLSLYKILMYKLEDKKYQSQNLGVDNRGVKIDT